MSPTIDTVPLLPHIWCSRDHRAVKAWDCDMCKRFYAKYPMDGFKDDAEMAAKYFPNAIPRR